MYFVKMRREAALFGRIEVDKGPPPPGSAPPLTGSAGSAAPTLLTEADAEAKSS